MTDADGRADDREGLGVLVPDQPQLVIISGMSGAGRTTAAKALEDLGYFVIDNLPPALAERVVALATTKGSTVDRIALVVDVRGRQFFADLRETLERLRRNLVSLRVMYLEASDDALVRRFEEARRLHPLAKGDRIVDGIEREREQLAELRAQADLVIDTSDLNVHELRQRVVGAFGSSTGDGLAVHVVAFGFKHGTPRDADLVFDVRFLPNPHWVPELRPFTGLDPQVRDYVMEQPGTVEFLHALKGLLDVMIPGFEREGKRYLTIAIGCTGGKHRSVALAEDVAAHIRARGLPVKVDHRDRTRG